MELNAQSSHPQVKVEMPEPGVLVATLNRPDEGNALCSQTIAALHAVCNQVNADESIRVVTISAAGPVFSTGMDFGSVDERPTAAVVTPASFANLLKRLTLLPAVTIANVEKNAFAGGVGLAAACDVVIAHPTVQFRLTEVIWGLQPANISPYLIRRMGYQRAYRMALTATPILANQAERFGLVDIVSEDSFGALKDLRLQASRVSRLTRMQTKEMFQSFWLLDDAMRAIADTAMHRALGDPIVQENLRRYRETGQFPWEVGK